MNKITIFLFSFVFSINCFSQVKDTIHSEDEIETIALKEVYVYSSNEKPMSDEEKKKYLLLQYRIRKVYPYACLAARKLSEIQKTLDTIPKNSKKHKFIRQKQQELEAQFSEEIKKLSTSQGKILIKLIYRQTGKSAYNLIKELRSGWKAFWYNSTAWFYTLSLKDEYDPTNNQQDFIIEAILQKNITQGYLSYQKPAINIDYQKLKNKWDKK